MDKYFDFVCNQANRIEKVFIMDTGEGRETYDGKLDMHIEDLSGWLIPLELKDKAIFARRNGETMEEFDKYYCFVRWLYDSSLNLRVEFRNY